MADLRFPFVCLVVVAASSMACGAADQGTTSSEGTTESANEAVTSSDWCDIGYRSSSYDGTSPEATGCANSAITKCSASVKTSSGAVVGTVQLRYSTSCGTVWGKTTSNIGTAYLYTQVNRNGPDYSCSLGGTTGTCVHGSTCTAEDYASSNYTWQLWDASSSLTASADGFISKVSYNDAINAIFSGYMNQTCSY